LVASLIVDYFRVNPFFPLVSTCVRLYPTLHGTNKLRMKVYGLRVGWVGTFDYIDLVYGL
jgi:hypothetical protein